MCQLMYAYSCLASHQASQIRSFTSEYSMCMCSIMMHSEWELCMCQSFRSAGKCYRDQTPSHNQSHIHSPDHDVDTSDEPIAYFPGQQQKVAILHIALCCLLRHSLSYTLEGLCLCKFSAHALEAICALHISAERCRVHFLPQTADPMATTPSSTLMASLPESPVPLSHQ